MDMEGVTFGHFGTSGLTPVAKSQGIQRHIGTHKGFVRRIHLKIHIYTNAGIVFGE